MTVTPKLALAALCAAALATTATPGFAQKKRAASAKTPVRVVSRVERSLAGVRLGTRMNSVFKQFGPPTDIQLGAGSSTGTGDAAAFGGASNPFGGGTFPSAGVQSLGGPPMPGAPAMPSPGGPPMPGLPTSGLPMPGGMPTGEAFPGAGGTGTEASPSVPTATFVYRDFNHHKGLQLEIQVDADQRVIQIIGTSMTLKPIYGVSTARGIGFGSSYVATTARYGNPESMTMAGTFLQASFQEKAHVAFQFLNQKVVRIVVAEVE